MNLIVFIIRQSTDKDSFWYVVPMPETPSFKGYNDLGDLWRDVTLYISQHVGDYVIQVQA